MSLPHPPGAPLGPPVPAAPVSYGTAAQHGVPMPATPGSPLEPLRAGRHLDRRHWLLAGLLAITGSAIVLHQMRGALGTLLGQADTYGWDVVSHELGIVAFGVLATSIAFLLAPGSIGRRLLAVLLLVVLVVAGLALQQATFYGTGVPRWSRWVVTGQSLAVLGAVVGWILASGARWWAWIAVLLVPGIAALPLAGALVGISSGVAAWLVSMAGIVIAVVTLLLTIPRRR